MARKVFISFLGTTDYVETIYKWPDGIKSSPTRFIQEAILERKAKDWTEKDAIYIFYTQKSHDLNWVDDGQKDKDRKPMKREGLETRIKKLGLKASINVDTISEGFSEEEIWDIFSKVYSKLSPSDQIYFDMTHAFRSIPLFVSSLFNFAQYMLDAEVVAVHYGAFEKLLEKVDKPWQISNLPIDERVAPIVDMTNIVKLQKLTETATSITEFGRIKKVSETILEASTNDKINEYITNISNAIKSLDEAIQTCRINDLKEGKYIGTFNCSFKQAKKDVPEPVRKLLDTLKKELKDFVAQNSYQNVEAAINWTRKHEMISQAATLAQEYMISYVVDYAKKKKVDNPYEHLSSEEKQKRKKDKKILFREFVGSILGMPEEDLKQSIFKGDLAIFTELRDTLLGFPFIKQLRLPYDVLREVRNSLNHGKGNKSFDELKSEFYNSYSDCIEVIHQYPL